MLAGLDRTLVAEDSGPVPSDMSVFSSFRPVLDQELSRFDTLPRHRVVDIQQRVYSFPGTEVIFKLKSLEEPFLIYGKEKKVRFPYKYPQNCCWMFRCNIL